MGQLPQFSDFFKHLNVMSNRAFALPKYLLNQSFTSPLLALGLCLMSTWIIAHFIFHKLKHYPPAIPGVPILGNLHQLKDKKPFKAFYAWAHKYGPIYTIKLGASTMVVINSSEIAKEAMINKFSSISTRKMSKALFSLTSQKTMVAMSDYGDEHKMLKKRILANLLGPNPQKENQHLRERAYMKIIDGIYSEIGTTKSVLNVREHIKKALFPFAMYQVLGRDPEFVYVDGFGRNVSRWEMFKAIVIDPLETVLDVDWRDFFPYLKWVPNKSLEDKITKVCQKRDAIVNALISEERQLLANGKKPNCYLDTLLTEATDLTDKQLLMSVWEPIIESSDTTLITIEWAMYEIATHPRIQEKLFEEISNVVGTRCVNEDDLPKLKYLEAIVKETLRKHTPVPILPPRHVDKDTKLLGYNIKKGWQIIINSYGINYNKDVWTNPEEWNPERVLGDEKLDLGFKDHRILPFGMGKRMCIGITQAMSIISTCIAIMVQHFKWALPIEDGTNSEVSTMLLTTHKLYPFEAIVTPRLSSHLSS